MRHICLFLRQSNPEIQDFMSKMGFNASYYKLEDYYMSKLLERIHGSIDKDIKTYVWQEVFDNKVEVSDSRICVTIRM